MSELEELEFDQRMLRSAMENTYLILTGKATWESLMDKASMQTGSVDQHNDTALLFNPMMDDYIESEEYEKCAEIVKIKENKYGTKR